MVARRRWFPLYPSAEWSSRKSSLTGGGGPIPTPLLGASLMIAADRFFLLGRIPLSLSLSLSLGRKRRGIPSQHPSG